MALAPTKLLAAICSTNSGRNGHRPKMPVRASTRPITSIAGPTKAGTMTAARSMRWAPTRGTKRALVRLPTVRNATWKAKNRP
jgi:hypothetical protein